MINYYFFSIYKKNSDRTVDRPVPSRGGPAPGGQRWDMFSFFEFGPPRTGLCGPSGFGPDRLRSDRLQTSSPIRIFSDEIHVVIYASNEFSNYLFIFMIIWLPWFIVSNQFIFTNYILTFELNKFDIPYLIIYIHFFF
jgi:hypothetical protein